MILSAGRSDDPLSSRSGTAERAESILLALLCEAKASVVANRATISP